MDKELLETFINKIQTIEIYNYFNQLNSKYESSVGFKIEGSSKKPHTSNDEIIRKFIKENEIEKLVLQPIKDTISFEAYFKNSKSIKIEMPKEYVENSFNNKYVELIDDITLKFYSDNIDKFEEISDNVENIFIRSSRTTNKIIYVLNENGKYDIYMYNSVNNQEIFKSVNCTGLATAFVNVFWDNNKDDISKYIVKGNAKIIIFSGNKVLSIDDNILVNVLSFLLNEMMDQLIDKKISNPTKPKPKMTISYMDEQISITDEHTIQKVNQLINKSKHSRRFREE